MWILLKLDYAKFGVSNLFCSKVIKEKPLEISSPPPPPLSQIEKEKLKTRFSSQPYKSTQKSYVLIWLN